MGWSSWNGDNVIRSVEEAVLKAKIDTGELVIGVAKNQVPLNESTLMKTGKIFIKEDRGEKIVIASFGGGAGTGFPRVPYAIRWHENNANFQHGRKRFYLKDPLYQIGANAYKEFLQRRLREVL